MTQLHGYTIAGEPLPELLAPGPGPLGTIEIEAADEAELLAPAAELTMLRDDARGAAFAIARRGHEVVVWGRGRGSFAVDAGRLRVSTAAPENGDSWAHQLATVVVPLALAERGAAAVHASGLVGPEGAILLAGASGRGKSTTALLAAGLGLAPIADDAVVFHGVGEVGVFAAGAGLWATPRAAAAAAGGGADGAPDGRAARRIHRPAPGPPAGEVPVAALVALDERGPTLRAEPLSPARALQRLAPSLLHVGDRAALERAFTALAAVVERVPAWSVSMPDSLERTREQLPGLIERLTR